MNMDVFTEHSVTEQEPDIQGAVAAPSGKPKNLTSTSESVTRDVVRRSRSGADPIADLVHEILEPRSRTRWRGSSNSMTSMR